MTKKPTITQVQKKLWEECKRIIKLLYGNTCYTCGKTKLEGSNRHTGHFLPKSTCGSYLKYDLRNLRPQCYSCNINKGGNGAIFYNNMVKKEGQEYVDKIFKDRQKIIKAYDYYVDLLIAYQKIKTKKDYKQYESTRI